MSALRPEATSTARPATTTRGPFRLVFLGLSLSSSWGNGHATTYRALLRQLATRGHEVLFLERDLPFYAANRDLPRPSFARLALYGSLEELRSRYATEVRGADVVVVGSYVPEGAEVADWVTRTARGLTAFYDIDTPVTLARLARGEHDYLRPDLVPRFGVYLSFTGGPTLRYLEQGLGAQLARALYCAADGAAHRPVEVEPTWDLGYLGTYAADRQPAVEALLLAPARAWPRGRFVVAGPQYPDTVRWPANVARHEHLAPDLHPAFYGAQRFTLNVTRADMVASGYSPSVRLFEAAACGVPVISDRWPGLEEFFRPDEELLVAGSTAEVLALLHSLPERCRRELARRARARVLAEHTAAHRAESLEKLLGELLDRRSRRRPAGPPARKGTEPSP